MKKITAVLLAASMLVGLAGSAWAAPAQKPKEVEILNVSYDPTRELYEEYNKAFASYWLKKTGQKVTVKQSHGGSGKQARSVIDGLKADVVTLALAYDVNAIEKAGLIKAGWEKKLAKNSAPYTSTIVFLVRKGNPKKIKDWNDLTRENISVITPNPKTSGGARWNYLAAWGYANKLYKGDQKRVKSFVQKLFRNVPVLDSGARGSTTTFVERELGDVLIAWENEAYLAKKEYGGKFEIVTPSLSILAEPPVAVVSKNVEKKNTREVATAYLDYLYTETGQTIAAKNFYRPTNEKVAKNFASQFKQLNLITIKDFGGWEKAQKTHFEDGGTFDQIYNN
ncbi:sulfate ABC transporter substrate-binding protein [Paenibacillus gansuensis]|uniref:Sulfate ABC transporter substrate-binding protein n=1 Tax=Paenibacillus gansuensis TaxID=306542 RepID=A0ABW5PA71_9BACL